MLAILKVIPVIIETADALAELIHLPSSRTFNDFGYKYIGSLLRPLHLQLLRFKGDEKGKESKGLLCLFFISVFVFQQHRVRL